MNMAPMTLTQRILKTTGRNNSGHGRTLTPQKPVAAMHLQGMRCFSKFSLKAEGVGNREKA
jgi:hypothetical protein